MSHENWKFYDLPKKLPMKSYKSSIDEFVRIVNKVKSVEAIYRAGSISVPGLSDLDLFVIFKNNARKVETIRINNLSPPSRQVIGHEIGYMQQEIFEKFDLYLFVQEPLELLYGNDIEYHNIEKLEDELLIKSIMVFEWLIHKALHLQQYLYKKRIPVRILLNKLWSFVYTLKLAKEVSDKAIGKEYIKDITELRTNWFSMKDSKRNDDLLRILHSETELAYITACELANTLNKNPSWMINFKLKDVKHSRHIKKIPGGNIVYRSPAFVILFTDNDELNTKTNIFDNYATCYSKFKIPFVILPKTLSAFLFYLTVKDGVLSQKIRRGILIPDIMDVGAIKSETADERARLLNRYYSWIVHNKIYWSLNTYGHPRSAFLSTMGNFLAGFSTRYMLSKISHLSLSASAYD